MKKVCLIRGEKNYIENKQYTYCKKKRRYKKGTSPQECIDKWSEIYEVNYFDFKAQIREIVLDNIESFNFDITLYNYHEFIDFLGDRDLDEDVLFYSQDDDDIIISDPVDVVIDDRTCFYEWLFYTVNLTNSETNIYIDNKYGVQSNHSLIYFNKEDLNILHDPFPDNSPIWHSNKKFKDINYNHFLYHMNLNEFKGNCRTDYYRTAKQYTINFIQPSSLSYIRNNIHNIKDPRSIIEETVECLDHLSVFHDNSYIQSLARVYEQLIK